MIESDCSDKTRICDTPSPSYRRKTASPKIAKTPYWQLLKDPRWQRKRLEILERDDWTCRHCGDNKNPLHVHHWYYLSFQADRKPWEYPNMALVTLCEDCHKAEDNRGEELNRFEAVASWTIMCLGGMENAEDMAELVSLFRRGEMDEATFISNLRRRMKDVE